MQSRTNRGRKWNDQQRFQFKELRSLHRLLKQQRNISYSLRERNEIIAKKNGSDLCYFHQILVASLIPSFMTIWHLRRRQELFLQKLSLIAYNFCPQGFPPLPWLGEMAPCSSCQDAQATQWIGEKSHFGDKHSLWTLLSNKAARLSRGHISRI